jgi:hypothetical protein
LGFGDLLALVTSPQAAHLLYKIIANPASKIFPIQWVTGVYRQGFFPRATDRK